MKNRAAGGRRWRWTNAYLTLCRRRPLLVLSVALAAVALAFVNARRIHVDPSLTAMLPRDSPSLKALETLERRMASHSSLYLLVTSSNPGLNRTLARDLLAAVRAWPETRWAIDRRDPSFFLDRRLLFLPEATLLDFAERVEDRIRWERCEAIPACVNVLDRPQLPTQAEVRAAYDEDPDVSALLSLFGGRDRLEDEGTDENTDESSNANAAPGPPRELGLLCSADGTICAIEAALRGRPGNLTFATQISERADALFRKLRPADAPPDLRMAISGAYRNGPMEKAIVSRDLFRTTLVGGALILLLMLAQFRTLRVVWLLGVPLVAGIIWTLGLIGAVHPELNMLSAFGLSVLAGLGIDFGIHLCTHYANVRAQGKDPAEAVTHTLAALGGPMVAAAATTSVGFVALLGARFRAFSEMGVMAALGVMVFLLGYLLLFPPLVLLAERLRRENVARMRPRRLRWLQTQRLPRLRLWGGLAIAAALGLWGTRISFEYDFRNLRAAEISHGIGWSKAVHGTTRTPIFVLGESAQRTQEVVESLRKEGPGPLGPEGEPWIFTARSFLPADQEARLAALQRLRAAVERALPLVEAADEPRAKSLRERFVPLLEVSGFQPSDVPPWVRDWLVERDGAVGSLAVLYSTLSGSNAHHMEILTRRLEEWRKRFPGVVFAAPTAPMGEVVPGLAEDTPVMLALALVGLLLGTFLVGRSWRRSLAVLVPLVLAMACTLGIAVALDVKVHLYNVIMFPLAFGLGVDGAIYLIWAARDTSASSSENRGIAATAILGSSLTTLAAFGSLLLANNPGIASLGRLALIAIGSTLAANLIWLPAALERVRHRAWL